MSIRDIIDRLRKAEYEIDEAKMALSAEGGLESQEKDAKDLRQRLRRLETQVRTIRGEGP